MAYRNSGEHWALYELVEELVDLEGAFRQWRIFGGCWTW